MGLENPQDTLDLLYAARRDLLTGKVASYTLGDRVITLLDLNDLNKSISQYEAIVVAGTPIFADLGGCANQSPWPEG